MTRELILRATAEAVAEDPLLGFSMQEVADRARVSHRSLYRYFPSRKQLFEALYNWVSERMEVQALADSIRTAEDLSPFVGKLFARFEAEAPIVRAGVIASLALGTQPSRRSHWDKAVARFARQEFPNLDADQARQAVAILRLLLSSRAWLTLSERSHFDAASAAGAVDWAISALMEDLKKRNARAGH